MMNANTNRVGLKNNFNIFWQYVSMNGLVPKLIESDFLVKKEDDYYLL